LYPTIFNIAVDETSVYWTVANAVIRMSPK